MPVGIRSVTVEELLATILSKLSWTWTTIAGLIFTPATAFVGCWKNTNLLAP